MPRHVWTHLRLLSDFKHRNQHSSFSQSSSLRKLDATASLVVSSAIFSGSSMPRRTAFVGSMLLTPVLVDVSNRYGLAVPGPVLNEAM